MTISVTFVHPRRSDKTLVADINPKLTVEQALAILHSPQTGPFLPQLQEGEIDELVLDRTETELASTQTMAEAGVIAGDVLRVVRGGTGASPHCSDWRVP